MNVKKGFSSVVRIGIDLAKNTLQIHGQDKNGKQVLQKNISRHKVLAFTANLNSTTIAMESCSSSHYWGREFQKQGHTVMLIPAQHVKPFVKTHKNDRVDAVAICEASTRPNMHCVPIKSAEQHEIQIMHRIRQNISKNRTALANQIRGFLGECGIVIPVGISNVFKLFPLIVEDAENQLNNSMRELLKEQFDELKHINDRYNKITNKIEAITESNSICKRLLTIEGIGPLTATALYAAVGNGNQFRKGRDMAAWLGLVPKQYSTGGRSRLGKISKHGNRYIRALMVGGARAVVQHTDKKDTRLSKWIKQIKDKKGYNVAVVALTNKTVRVAWSVLTKGEEYDLNRQEQLAQKYNRKAA